MSRLFDRLSEDEILHMDMQWEQRINEEWELHCAGEDLQLGIQVDQPFEFVNPESN